MKYFIMLSIALFINNALMANVSQKIHCHDTDTFIPLEFIFEDNGVDDPVISFLGIDSRSVIILLGLNKDSGLTWSVQDLEIYLKGKIKRHVSNDDHKVVHFRNLDLKQSSTAQFENIKTGTIVEKEIIFKNFEITKTVTATIGTYYVLSFTAIVDGSNMKYEKLYYDFSCR